LPEIGKRRVVNVVVTADLKQPIDLLKLTELKDVQYDPTKYHGNVAYFKSKKMQGKVNIFMTGKLISVGTSSVNTAKKELTHVADSLAKAKFIKPIRTEPVVRSVVVSVNLRKALDLTISNKP